MTWTLVLPAGATVVALIGLTLGLRRVEAEALLLRHSLRRTAATAVAVDDLHRSVSRERKRAESLDLDAQGRIHRVWRTGRPRPGHGDR